jgi:hypothetical protein
MTQNLNSSMGKLLPTQNLAEVKTSVISGDSRLRFRSAVVSSDIENIIVNAAFYAIIGKEMFCEELSIFLALESCGKIQWIDDQNLVSECHN